MLYLEQAVNHILRREGQVIVTLEDLQISWQDVEALFIGIYKEAREYLSIYDWTTDYWSMSPDERPDYLHIKHINYNPIPAMSRIMPDLWSEYWEFNPYTKNASAIMNTNFSLEVQKYATLENLEYEVDLSIPKEQKKFFSLPCSFYPEDFSFNDFVAYPCDKDSKIIHLEGENGIGEFNEKTLQGYIFMDEAYKGTLTVTSKYVGIKEWDLHTELFMVWFSAALMQYIGAMKKQFDLSGVGLPFDINADGLLERGRQLMDRVEELKCSKSTWSNF